MFQDAYFTRRRVFLALSLLPVLWIRIRDPDPYWIRIQSGLWIRIRIRIWNPDPDPDPDPGGQK